MKFLQRYCCFMRKKSANPTKNHYIIKNDIYDEFVGQLPFKPTTAQRRAMKEIAQDIKNKTK